jgi:hypothetical protein
MRTDDFLELQIAFLSAKHQKVVAGWGAFNQKRRHMSVKPSLLCIDLMELAASIWRNFVDAFQERN